MADIKAEINALLDRMEPRLRESFLRAIDNLTDRVDLLTIQRALERGDLDAALDAMHLDPVVFRDLEAALTDAYAAGGDLEMNGFPFPRAPQGGKVVLRFDVRNPEAEAWLREWSSTRITGPDGVIERMRQAIRPALATSLEAGRGPRATALDIVGRKGQGTSRRSGGLIGLTAPHAEIVQEVRLGLMAGDQAQMERYLGLKRRDKRSDRKVAKALEEGRALGKDEASGIAGRLADRYLALRGEMIARTETLSALAASRHEAFRQGLARTNYSPDQVIKIWDSAGDGRVRHSHAALDGDSTKAQRVRGLEAYFVSPTGARLQYPGDRSGGAPASEVIGCRCYVRYKIDVFGRA